MKFVKSVWWGGTVCDWDFMKHVFPNKFEVHFFELFFRSARRNDDHVTLLVIWQR